MAKELYIVLNAVGEYEIDACVVAGVYSNRAKALRKARKMVAPELPSLFKCKLDSGECKEIML